jgi:uncharacterized coiled-coil protein SlyX
MNTLINFISEHRITLTLVSVPLLYITLKDIILYLRKRKETAFIEQQLQEKYTRLDALNTQLKENKQSLIDSFTNMQEISSTLKNIQNQAQNTPDSEDSPPTKESPPTKSTPPSEDPPPSEKPSSESKAESEAAPPPSPN